MSEKTFKSRVIQKHDTEANWSKASFIPKLGEIIIYDIDSTYDYERMKIGDGQKDINSLPFADDHVKESISTLETNTNSQITTVSQAVLNVTSLVGDTAVSDQIDTAIASKSDVGHTHTYSDVGADKSGAADAALTSAKSYTDTAISNLINSAPTTLDTLGEIATAMEENADVVEALETSVGTKANASDLTSHTSNQSNPHSVTLSQLGVTATSTELNYVDGVTSNIQTQLNAKASTSHGTHVTYSTTAPVMDGTASAGSASTVARSDHKHPTDTSRAAASDVSALQDLVGDTSVASQIENAVVNKADIANGQYAVSAASDDGIAYTATVPGITALTVGANFIFIPSITTASTAPTVDVNGLGAKTIKRRRSNLSSATTSGPANNWLFNGKPFRLLYDGSAWIAEDRAQPAASDLYGTVTSANEDAEGQVISETYIKDISYADQTLTYTKGNGTTGTVSLSELASNILNSVLPKITTITVGASSWSTESDNMYYQDVSSTLATATTKIDIQPTQTQLVEWQDAGFAFTTSSSDGFIRIYVTGNLPTVDYTIQIMVQEVVVV